MHCTQIFCCQWKYLSHIAELGDNGDTCKLQGEVLEYLTPIFSENKMTQ